MTKKDHERLLASGMLWVFFPEFTGTYNEDIILWKERMIREGTTKPPKPLKQ